MKCSTFVLWFMSCFDITDTNPLSILHSRHSDFIFCFQGVQHCSLCWYIMYTITVMFHCNHWSLLWMIISFLCMLLYTSYAGGKRWVCCKGSLLLLFLLLGEWRHAELLLLLVTLTRRVMRRWHLLGGRTLQRTAKFHLQFPASHDSHISSL